MGHKNIILQYILKYTTLLRGISANDLQIAMTFSFFQHGDNIPFFKENNALIVETCKVSFSEK